MKTVTAIRNLSSREAGWDGHNAPMPQPRAIEHAGRWIEQAYAVVAAAPTVWHDPYVSSDESGDVSLEWWNGTRKITVYVTPEIVEYVQMCGPDIVSQMEDGEITCPAVWRKLWDWLGEGVGVLEWRIEV